MKTTTLARFLGTLVARPAVLWALARAAWRFRSRDWWRRFPFLPLPPREYLAWRLHTAYGDEDRVPTADELARYMVWANRMHGTRRRGANA